MNSVALLTLALSLSAAPLAKLPKGVVTTGSIEGFTEYVLPNGLKVVLAPDSSTATITVNMTVFVGSRHEDYGEKGMAHLFEHMLFKRTKTRDIKKTLSELGGDANATTWYDRTNYFETFHADEASLATALALEADRLVNAVISREELATEMTVVRNELEMGENDGRTVLSERVTSTAFIFHNYRNSTIGAPSDIERVPTARLQSFYERYYRPDNALLVVAGKLDEAKTLQLVFDAFAKTAKPRTPVPTTYTAEPVQDGERFVAVRRVGGTPLLDVQYHVPAATDPDFAAVAVLASVLGDQASGRLHKALVEPKKAASAECNAPPLHEAGFLECSVELAPTDSVQAAKDLLLSQLEKLAAAPVTNAETERAKTKLVNGFEQQLNAADRVALELSEYAAAADWRFFFIARDRIKTVTATDVNRVAQKYLKSSNRTLGEYAPTDNPDRAQPPALVDFAPVIAAYEPAAFVATQATFEASPKNLETHTQRSTFKNGLSLSLVPKGTRAQTVRVAVRLNVGSLKTLVDHATAHDTMARLLTRGTKTKTRAQFEDALDALNARLTISSSVQAVDVRLEVRRANLSAALNLVAEALKTPAFDPKELEASKREQLATLLTRREDPEAVTTLTLDRALAPYPQGHPFYVSTFDERIADVTALTLDSVKSHHAALLGASAAKVAVVGDFDATEVTAQLNALFGEWVAPQPYERIERPYRPVDPADLTAEMPDKANAALIAAMPVKLKDSDADFVPLMVADWLLGGGFLNGRITQRLREREGLSYHASTFLDVSSLDDSAVMGAYAIYAPQNEARLEAALTEELQNAVAAGFTVSELKLGVSGLQQARAANYADDWWVATTLLGQAAARRTFTYDSELDAKLSLVTADSVWAALEKHLDPARLSVVRAGDFKKLHLPR